MTFPVLFTLRGSANFQSGARDKFLCSVTIFLRFYRNSFQNPFQLFVGNQAVFLDGFNQAIQNSTTLGTTERIQKKPIFLPITLSKILDNVIDRKNFLFANTPGGAEGSTVIFTMIQTAIENGLDPYRYLTWLLKTANCADLNDPDVIQSLLPWNAPAECRVK